MPLRKAPPIVLAAVLAVSHLPALAEGSKAGVWKLNGYQIGSDGNRIPCENGSCLKLPGGPDLSKVCVPANGLFPYAEQHLQQISQLIKIRLHNCKETWTSSATHEEHDLKCDEGIVLQSIEQPDSSHLAYKTITESTQGQPSKLESGANFEWIADDCTGVSSVIR